MKTITVKFHRVVKYTDPTGMFHMEIRYGMMGEEIMGFATGTCNDFPPVISLLGPFDPKCISEIEQKLIKDESKGEIRNLVLEDEVILEGVEVRISSGQIMMN